MNEHTERSAEPARPEIEERFRIMAEKTDQVFWFTELEPEKVLYVSPAFERLWGVPVERLYRDPRLWMQGILPEDRERVARDFEKWVSGETTEYNVEFRVARPDGTIRWVEDHGTVIGTRLGRPHRLSGIAKDITDRKHLDAVLVAAKDELERKVDERTAELLRINEQLKQEIAERRQAELELRETQHQLAEARRLSDIGTLAATVAHELRNPLAAMHMAAYNIRRKSEPGKLDSHLNTIDKKVKESDQIINNLLFYSRLRPPHFEEVYLHEEIGECASEARERRAQNQITLELEVQALKKAPVRADRLQIREVINNLLNNAYDAILDKTGSIRISAEVEDQCVRISVRDSGPGISPGDMERVFDPFFTTKAKGTGLGLTVCRQILKMHEGSIRIVSAEGEGACVEVILPRERA